MKLITQLTGTVTEGEFADPRGVLTAMYLDDPECLGWKIQIGLCGGGLFAKAMRPGGGKVAIPFDELVRLAQTHAPELFASAEAKREIAKQRARRVIAGPTPET